MSQKTFAKTVVSILGISLMFYTGVSGPVYIKAEGDDSQQVLVVYKNTQGKQDVLNQSEEVEKQYKNVPAVSVTMDQEEIDNLKNNPNVAYVEPNTSFRVSNNEMKPYQLNSGTAGATSSIPAEESQWDLQASKPSAAWSEGITGKGVKVAILDTGIASHSDLTVSGGVSMVSYTTSYSDDNGHGTHVAGIVGARRNGTGIVGMAPESQLYAVKVLDNTGEGSLSEILSGIDWAISNRMNIINLSLGTDSDSQLLHDMIDKASSNGLLVVCASGNSGNADGIGDSINYPAKYSSALSVAAVDSDLVRGYFSSTGDKIDFSGAGVDIVSTYLNNGFAIGSGTSQAAPHITGLLALLKQKYPTKTNAELISTLKSYSIDLGSPGKDSWYGNGFAQYQIASTVLPAKGYLDSPSYGEIIKGQKTIQGWFLDGSGVSKIELLIDGKSIGTAQYGLSRLDVQSAFPDYQNNNSGFQYILNTNNLTNGNHTLTIRETGNNSKTTDLSTVVMNVQNLSKMGYLDTPEYGSTINGQSPVNGWFLDDNGVSKIEVLVDGQVVGEAQYALPRLDVQKVFPQYQNGYSGFQYSLNTKNFSVGQHTLTVRETGKDGTITNLSDCVVTVQRISKIGYLDTPANGSILKGFSSISGWFLDDNGVSKIEVLVDGQVAGEAQYGLSRGDVQTVFPGYQNGNSGYSFSLDTKKFSEGQHSLAIRETSKDGMETTIANRTIIVQRLLKMGYLDSPRNGSTMKGQFAVNGWFLDDNGVSNIEVLIDGQVIGQAQYGLPRGDVQSVFPEYQNGNSGYRYILDTKNLQEGQHTLTIREKSKDGSSTILTNQSVNIQHLSKIGYLDSPSMGSIIKGQSIISGWYLDESGVARIEVLIDGQVKGQAQYGNPRGDVQKVFPEYQNGNSGYQYTLDTQQIPNGNHTLMIKETGANGGTSTLTTQVTINN